MKEINVLSLFDGMSCGQIALQKLGIKVSNYFACEIDKHAIKVTQHNFPNTIQLGDVTKVSAKDLPKIDLLIGGSPCQGFSFAGKQLAFDDPRSKLFFEFVRLKNECNPTYFMLENVKMKKEFEIIISKYMGVSPIEINSVLLSAQNRVRLYWTNIANEPYGFFGDMQCVIPQPKDKGLFLKDILEIEVDEKYYLSEKTISTISEYAKDYQVTGKSPCLTTELAHSTGRDFTPRIAKEIRHAQNFQGLDINKKSRTLRIGGGQSQDDKHNFDLICVASRGRNPENPKSREAGLHTEQHLEPRTDGKTNCLTSVKKDNLVMQVNPSTESGGKQPYQQNRVYDANGISPALCAGKSDLLIREATKKGFTEIKPGECFDIENPNSKTRRGRKMKDKSNCLMAKETDFLHYTNDFKIRRLTPTECERLQTVPDGYTDCVSDTQRYRMLGNGWTVDVIAYIFSFIKL